MVRQYGAPKEEPGKPSETGNRYGDNRKDPAPKPKEEDPSPPTKVVTDFHKNAPVDTSDTDIHHTLGSKEGQASPGPHTHDGGTSALLLEGMIITGSKSSPVTMWPSIIAGLVRLGMKDSSTS